MENFRPCCSSLLTAVTYLLKPRVGVLNSLPKDDPKAWIASQSYSPGEGGARPGWGVGQERISGRCLLTQGQPS